MTFGFRGPESMTVYDEFAHFYKHGHYPEFSRRMAELLPDVLELFNARPKKILDLACGEGTFAIALARRGFHLTGVDRSAQMLRHARERARRDDVMVTWRKKDMRSLSFAAEFDLVTCWFDSLNYLLDVNDLCRTFAGVYRALKNGGMFIFDMNTIHGLSVTWQRIPCVVQTDEKNLFEILRPEYDYESNVATLHLTGFRKTGDSWRRMDEKHQERGYTLAQIDDCLDQAGLYKLACWGSFQDRNEPQPDSSRVWYVVGK